MLSDLKTPKVFISYAWTNDEHVEWVVKLAERLQTDGVEVILDQWDFKEGHDKYVFMEQMVVDPTVEKVLAVCDRKYAAKADGREGGVGTESQIISKDIYDKVKQEKFIPLIRERDDEGNECVPVFFRNRKYIDFSDDDEFPGSYERLVRVLFGKPERVKPALGKPPAHLLTESAPVVRPAVKLERLKAAVEKGKPHTQAMLQDYLNEFLGSMEQFRVADVDKKAVYDEVMVKSITDFIPYRDSFIEFAAFAADYLDNDDTLARVTEFMQEIAAFQHRPNSRGSWTKEDTDNYRFIGTEMFLYLIACFIKARKFRSAAYFIEFPYQVAQSLGGSEFDDAGLAAFTHHIRTLDDFRRSRQNLRNDASVTAQFIADRATNLKVDLRNLIDVDMLLYVRHYFPSPGGATYWYPHCEVFQGRITTLDLFAKAVTPPGFEAVKQLLKVQSMADLVARLKAMFVDDSFKRSFDSRWWRTTTPAKIFNLERLAAAAGVSP